VYGNVADDGLDHSVNIFVDKDTFNAFLMKKIKKQTGEIEDPESEKDPDDLFEMTVDFTESAIMGILKATGRCYNVCTFSSNVNSRSKIFPATNNYPLRILEI
jgi:hypothetical protein